MDIRDTINVLEALAAGCSPKTGQLIDYDSVLNEREVIRALQIAINELKKLQDLTIPKQKKKQNFSEIDFFQKENFNYLTEAEIHRVKEEVKKLGVQKTTDLSEQVLFARRTHPRAYESWTDQEKTLLRFALQKTNDLELLSKCFMRGTRSIESFGEKILREDWYGNSTVTEFTQN